MANQQQVAPSSSVTVDPGPDTVPVAGTSPPLSGIKVVDWTHVLAGPYAAYNLALLGADVIRIERADSPDIIRAGALDPVLARLELGEAFVMQSGGKRSLAVDARDPRIKEVLGRLISRSDILLENFRPGKLAELRFGPTELIERHPHLVVCSITGFGQDGPLARRRAYDHVIQAMSGLMAANCDMRGMPMRIGLPIIDYATGMQAALAILAALHRRSVDGLQGRPRTRGEWLDVSMHGVALTLTAPAYASHAVSGMERAASRATAFSGNPLSGTFESAHGHIAIVCNTDIQSQAFLDCLPQAGASSNEIEVLTSHVRARDVDAVHAGLRPILLKRSATDWEAFFSGHEVPAAEVRQPSAAYDLALTDARSWVTVALDSADHRKVQVPGIGFKSTEPLTPVMSGPPVRGQHSHAIVAALGFAEEEIESMFADGALVDLTRSKAAVA